MDEKEIISKSRLEALTDGIFAFSMTLLVIFIELPHQNHLGNASMFYVYLKAQYPQFISYLVTFLLLANFWVIHHKISRCLKRVDFGYLWLNIFFMLFIVLLPFSSALLGDYHRLWGSIFIFLVNLFLITNMLFIIWLYGSYKNRLLDENININYIKNINNQLMLFSAISFLSIFVCFIYPPGALYIYFLVPLLVIFYSFYKSSEI